MDVLRGWLGGMLGMSHRMSRLQVGIEEGSVGVKVLFFRFSVFLPILFSLLFCHVAVLKIDQTRASSDEYSHDLLI